MLTWWHCQPIKSILFDHYPIRCLDQSTNSKIRLSNFTNRVVDIVNDVNLDSLSETELFEIPQLPTDFGVGDFNLTEIENFILNSIRKISS